MKKARAADRHESEIERVDRNLEELMAELRVALPGVQVLFAFLLILPFNQRFEEVGAFGEKVYLGTLLCAAASAALLIGPTVQHRLQFRADRKLEILTVSQRLTIAGLVFLAISITGAVVLVADFVFGTAVAVASAGLVGGMIASVWFVLPIWRRS